MILETDILAHLQAHHQGKNAQAYIDGMWVGVYLWNAGRGAHDASCFVAIRDMFPDLSEARAFVDSFDHAYLGWRPPNAKG